METLAQLQTETTTKKKKGKERHPGKENGKWVTTVPIRATIALSLPDSAVSCPELKSISRQLWHQQLVDNGHSLTKQVTERIRLRQETYVCFVHSLFDIVTVKHNRLMCFKTMAQQMAYSKCYSDI